MDATVRLTVSNDGKLTITQGSTTTLAIVRFGLEDGIEISVGRETDIEKIVVSAPPGVEVDIRELLNPQSPLGVGIWLKKKRSGGEINDSRNRV
ncbi:hypothetical protein KKD19_06120 [Patescibacteria group bacterium]|nr:hypothetical protein [Patescibacteria group bacterium]MBU4512780.1 hypothetical protein [Patescibacteria group bacterium]MCG2692531.1 hypothetical protein [Candidatus Parcubacteria bacterium]